jgi:glycosyltransferase involved in cell wall biosynthesis
MMRVVYLCCDSGIPIFGTKGAAVHIRELAHAFANVGCDIHILVARQGGNPPKGWNLPVYQFQLTGWPAIIQDLLAQEAHTPGWERRIKDWRALAYAQYLTQAAQPLLRRLQPDVLYERYSLFSWAGQALAADLDIPHIVEINAPLANEQARYRQLELNATAAGLEARILLGANLVVAVSREVRDYVLVLGARSDDVTVLPNGVDVHRFSPQADGNPVRRAFGLEGAFVIGFVGSLKAWHGVDGLLTASAGLPDSLPWRLLLVGDGPQRTSIAEQAATLGVSDRVVFTGSVPHDQIPAYLAAIDVAVAPYPALDDYYFSPLKLFEYMAMARPVVAPALGQIAEVVVHHQNGWLYPPGDIGALREALIHLATSTDLRAHLGARARADVVAHHTWTQNAERLMAWISKLERKRSGKAKPRISSRDQVMIKPVG